MSSAPKTPGETPAFTRTFGLRLALWYATLFVVGAIAIVFVTYYLTASSLAQRDHQIINGKLGDYAAAYLRGGVRVLASTVRAEQQTAPERLFVRVVDRGVESVVLSNTEGWDPDDTRDRVGDAGRRHAGAGRQEHRGARRSARPVPRHARLRHPADRRRSR